MRRVPAEQPLLQGWIGLFGLIFLLHFGSFHLIALFWQAMGIDAQPIMSKPILSRTLSEFWGRRWNLGFRQLAHEFIFRPLHKRTGVAVAGLLVFVASGLIHDLVISVPARGGYGLPTGYFLLQGLGVTFERSRWGAQIGLQDGVRRPHLCYRRDRGSGFLALSSAVCDASHHSIHAGDPCPMTNFLAERCFDLILWLAGAGHFVILAASFQVPSRLRWKQDLAQLMPFNRKLLWVQSGVHRADDCCVRHADARAACGTAARRPRGDGAGLFYRERTGRHASWSTRFYFSHEDWPKGRQFVIGHILLTSLFVALAGSYWGLLAWQMWGRTS